MVSPGQPTTVGISRADDPCWDSRRALLVVSERTEDIREGYVNSGHTQPFALVVANQVVSLATHLARHALFLFPCELKPARATEAEKIRFGQCPRSQHTPEHEYAFFAQPGDSPQFRICKTCDLAQTLISRPAQGVARPVGQRKLVNRALKFMTPIPFACLYPVSLLFELLRRFANRLPAYAPTEQPL